MKINRNHIITAAVLLCACAALVFAYTSGRPVPAEPAAQAMPQAGSISLSVQGLYTAKQVALTSNETMLQALQALDAADPALKLSTKEYSGLGTLVVGMHGLVNGTGKNYWQYKVNGVAPQIGAGDYVLKNGDSVEWFFSSSQE